MPDPNQNDQNQNNNQIPSHPDPVMDIPPVMGDTPPTIPNVDSPNPPAEPKPAFTETVVEEKPEETTSESSQISNLDEQNNSSNGSAAPSDISSDNPIISTSPKKKFAGGKIIATILGVLMLVGGIGGGVYLTQQQQDIREKAANNACELCKKNADNVSQCAGVCSGTTSTTTGGSGSGGSGGGSTGSTTSCSGTCDRACKSSCGGSSGSAACTACQNSSGSTGSNNGTTSSGGGAPVPGCVTDNGCGAGQICSNGQCVTGGSNSNGGGTAGVNIYCSDFNKVDCAFGCTPTSDGGKCKQNPNTGFAGAACLPGNVCNAGLNCVNGTCTISSGSSSTNNCANPPSEISCVGDKCTVGKFYNSSSANDVECVVNHYWCQGVKEPGVGCQDALISRGQTETFSKNCGTEQLDIICKPKGISGVGCYNDASYTKTWTSRRYTSNCSGGGGGGGSPTASCVSIKAYTPDWVALSNSQLSQLKANDSVSFCVNGTASTGTFTKAKFTINNVAQAESTTKRPGFDDYCQLYKIPEGTTTFNVTAQIHHATLGWK